MTLRVIGTTVVGVALVAALAGCGSGGSDRPASLSSPGRGSASPSAPATPSGPLALHEVAEVKAPGDVGPVALGEDTVAFPYAEGASTWTKVGVARFGETTPSVVASSEWPHGLINWVATTGDWVVYVDQSAEQSDTAPRVLWRIHAVDTKTHQRVLLASNGQTPDPYVPIARGADGWFFWTSAETDNSARESVWRAGWKQPKDLLRHTEMTPGTETLADGRLVYLGPNGTGAKGHTVGGDCWSVPITGGRPEPLTRTALAMGCVTGGDALVWTQHIEAHPKPMPADGVLDDPYTVWTQPLDGGSPRMLTRGYIEDSYPLAGDGFASWNPGGRPVVRSLSSTRKVGIPAGHYAVAGTASGRHLTYTTQVGNGPSVVHVEEVSGG